MIYVDAAIHPWKGKKWCHLTADSLEELHAFACDKLGLKASWFQNHRVMPHYDITASKRREAIKLGAIAITTKESAQRIVDKLKSKSSEKSLPIGE